MTIEEAIAWLKGERSTVNVVPQHPLETWQSRIMEADAFATQQAYWIVRAQNEGIVPEETKEDKK